MKIWVLAWRHTGRDLTLPVALLTASVIAGGSASASRLAVQDSQADARSSGASTLDGVFTSAQASRGEETFSQVCASCHDTNEFSGGRFRLSWVDQTAGDLFDTISTLMPEADPGSLSPAEYASLVAYIFILNGYPAGEVELPADLVALQRVRIVASPTP